MLEVTTIPSLCPPHTHSHEGPRSVLDPWLTHFRKAFTASAQQPCLPGTSEERRRGDGGAGGSLAPPQGVHTPNVKPWFASSLARTCTPAGPTLPEGPRSGSKDGHTVTAAVTSTKSLLYAKRHAEASMASILLVTETPRHSHPQVKAGMGAHAPRNGDPHCMGLAPTGSLGTITATRPPCSSMPKHAQQ